MRRFELTHCNARRSNASHCFQAIGAVLAGVVSSDVSAAGHFAVDDAAILDEGQCQVEVWTEHDQRARRRLLHLGPACRKGPFEVGLNVDRTSITGAVTTDILGPQLKWAHSVTSSVSLGIVAGAFWQIGPTRYLGPTFYVPLSWRVTDAVQVDVNVGRDYPRGLASHSRDGIAIAWQADPNWRVIAERFKQSDDNFVRLGLRRQVNASLNIDFSNARSLRAGTLNWWSLGLNWTFDRAKG